MSHQTTSGKRKTRTRQVGQSGYCTRRLHVEALEQRSLLALTAGLATADWDPPDEIDPIAVQAAQVAFHGPDLVGKDGALARLGPELISLFEQKKLYDQRSLATPFVPVSSVPLEVAGDMVKVQVVASGDVGPLTTALAALGMQHIDAYGRVIAGDVPIASLDRLAALPAVDFARPSYAPRTSAGAVLSQGDAALRADLARAAYGVDGSGVTVGILSDSFNALGGMAGDIATADLPSNTTLLDDIPSGDDEGRAMGQLVHDLAPGAAIQFATAFRSEPSFANNILLLASAGSDVIVDDVFYLDEPYFQDGIVAQAASAVAAQGVPYFSAAGNDADASYESPFVNSGIRGGPYGSFLHDFDPGPGVSTLQKLTIPIGGTAILAFQWDQPYRSAGGAGSASDLDIALLGANGTTMLDYSDYANIGDDPFEIVGLYNGGGYDLDANGIPDTTFYVRIEHYDGPAAGTLKYINFGDGTIATFATNSGTTIGHPNAEGVMGVAASWYYRTGSFGTSPPQVNDFSSLGGVPILFDTAGNRLAVPIDRMQPGVTGVDGTNTTFFGGDNGYDPDPYPNFFGTSAAAPHVAAVAALMIDSAGGPGSLAPSVIYDAMESTAIDIVDRFVFSTFGTTPISGGVGFDRFSGYGLVDALAAIRAVTSDEVVGRYLFYNNSAYDGDNGAINTSDDAAIATNKLAYLPGQGLAVFNNVSSYSRGLNGIMIDLKGGGAHEAISLTTLAEDFDFRVGNNNSPSTWSTAPTPSAVAVRTQPDGSHRITITWDDGAIKNQWLEVQVLPTGRTGLTTADVFFWGNKVGDIGKPTATSFTTTAAGDVDAIVSSGLGIAAGGITNPRDIDRSKTITVEGDRAAAIANIGAITRINIGANGPFASNAVAAADGLAAGNKTVPGGEASRLASALAVARPDTSPAPPPRLPDDVTSSYSPALSPNPVDACFEQIENFVSRTLPSTGLHPSEPVDAIDLDDQETGMLRVRAAAGVMPMPARIATGR